MGPKAPTCNLRHIWNVDLSVPWIRFVPKHLEDTGSYFSGWVNFTRGHLETFSKLNQKHTNKLCKHVLCTLNYVYIILGPLYSQIYFMECLHICAVGIFSYVSKLLQWKHRTYRISDKINTTCSPHAHHMLTTCSHVCSFRTILLRDIRKLW
jgi:hypothetical protein